MNWFQILWLTVRLLLAATDPCPAGEEYWRAYQVMTEDQGLVIIFVDEDSYPLLDQEDFTPHVFSEGCQDDGAVARMDATVSIYKVKLIVLENGRWSVFDHRVTEIPD